MDLGKLETISENSLEMSDNLVWALVATFGSFPRVMSIKDKDMLNAMERAANSKEDKQVYFHLISEVVENTYIWVKITSEKVD